MTISDWDDPVKEALRHKEIVDGAKADWERYRSGQPDSRGQVYTGDKPLPLAAWDDLPEEARTDLCVDWMGG